MNKFEWLCSLLPSDVNWGDAITPDIVEHIVLAVRERCAAYFDDSDTMIYRSEVATAIRRMR